MPDAVAAARDVYKPRRAQASPLFMVGFGPFAPPADGLRRALKARVRPVAPRGRAGGRPVSGVRRARTRLRAHPLRRLRARVSARVLVHVSLLLPEFPCPSGWRSGRSGWTPHGSRRCRTDQVVRTIPKRLRAYCLYRHRLRGEIACVAARTVTAAIRRLTGERARSALSPVSRRMARAPTGIRICTCSSRTAGSGPTARSSRGRCTTRRG